MYTIIAIILGLVSVILAQTTSCPACDSLLSLWDPDQSTGSCLGSLSNPVQYIVNFEQCICSPQSQGDYSACVACGINGDGGVPIDGLNFGPAWVFQSACSVFAADVTSVLEPSGLNAFARVVAPVMTGPDATLDILGYYIFQDVLSETVVGTGNIATDSITSTMSTPTMQTTVTKSVSGKTTASVSASSTGTTASVNASSTGTKVSDAGRFYLPIKALCAILALAITAAVFL